MEWYQSQNFDYNQSDNMKWYQFDNVEQYQSIWNGTNLSMRNRSSICEIKKLIIFNWKPPTGMNPEGIYPMLNNSFT
jgi:hypothetical protein